MWQNFTSVLERAQSDIKVASKHASILAERASEASVADITDCL